MHNELINLLPADRRDLLEREYRYRFGVVVIWLGTLLVAVAAVLLLPTYVFLAGSASSKDAHLASIRASLSSSDQAALSARLSMLSDDAATLMALSRSSSVSKVVSAVLAVSRPGVTVSGFTYTAAAGKAAGTLALSGTAATRDALRSYQLALQSAPFARSADLPVSAYAKDTNIDFIITITLAP